MRRNTKESESMTLPPVEGIAKVVEGTMVYVGDRCVVDFSGEDGATESARVVCENINVALSPILSRAKAGEACAEALKDSPACNCSYDEGEHDTECDAWSAKRKLALSSWAKATGGK